jgi:hypothetical protein
MRRKITNDIWEQIKTGYAAGVGLREIARKMKISEGTVLSHAKRHVWTQRIQVATRNAGVMQSDAITPVQSVPQSLAAILAERRDRTRLGLSMYTAEAAEQAAGHPKKLEIVGKVKDVASVHKTLWPEQVPTNQILNMNILTGVTPGRVILPGEEGHAPEGWEKVQDKEEATRLYFECGYHGLRKYGMLWPSSSDGPPPH